MYGLFLNTNFQKEKSTLLFQMVYWSGSSVTATTTNRIIYQSYKTPPEKALKNQTDVLKERDKTIPNLEKYSPFLIEN